MRALITDGAGGIRMEDMPMPKLGEFDSLVRIEACGICNTTDRELANGVQPYHSDYPAVLGHESVGVVVETGPGVTTFKPGDRVSRPCRIFSGENENGIYSCWGGFAEYGIVRDGRAMAAAGFAGAADDYTMQRQNIVPAGLDVRSAVAALSLAETASWTRAVCGLAGKRVCVAGTGMAGMSIGLWCKLAGAEKVIVTGRRDSRLETARRICADAVVNVCGGGDAARMIADAAGGQVDVFCEASGDRGQRALAHAVLAHGGCFARYAVLPRGGYDEPKHVRSDLTEIAPDACEHLAYVWVCDLLKRGIVDAGAFMTHMWKASEYADAFKSVFCGEVLKGMIVFDSAGV